MPRPHPVRGLRAARARARRAEERPHRHRHGQRLRLPDALRPERGLPARDDEEGALPVDRLRAALVPPRRRQRPLAAGARRHDLGRVGRRGRRPRPRLRRPVAQLADAGRAARSTRSPRSCACCARIRTRAASSSAPGTSPTCRGWRSRRATRFFQFHVGRSHERARADAGGSAASCTSAARTCSSASRSTSRATRCSRTCSRSSATSRSGDFVWTGGDCHIYDNHREQIETQLARDPFPYPSLRLRRRPPSIFDYDFEDFEVVGYEHHPAIRAPVAV